MRVFSVVQALGFALIASTSFAQAPVGQAPKPAAPPVQPAPRPPAPAAPPAAAAPAPAAPRFQDGLKYAYINVQVVAANSAEGKAATEKVKAFQDQKVKELNDKNKVLQSAQQKLEQGGSVMNDQARAQLQSEIERQQRDVQRFTEDAQQEVQTFTQQLQAEFERKLNPIIDKVAKEKQVHFVFSAAESGLVWADPGMDLTAEVIKAFDSTAPAAAARPAPAPAAPATVTPVR
jgi:outer membrane protein